MRKLLLILLWIFVVFPFCNVSAQEKLDDVTNGSVIRWIITSSEAIGVANITRVDWETRVSATFSNLTSPQWWDFYEGWLVRKSPFKMISTGRLVSNNTIYTNYFSTPENISTYSHYVLTLEPDNDNPGPGYHILEWKINTVENIDPVILEEKTAWDGTIIELSDYQKQLLLQVEARLVNVSSLQRISLLGRVLAFQKKLPNLNLEKDKQDTYAEILEVLVYVLS